MENTPPPAVVDYPVKPRVIKRRQSVLPPQVLRVLGELFYTPTPVSITT